MASEKQLKYWNKMKGVKRSKETCSKMSQSKKGEKHPNFGKHFSEEYKKKLSDSHIGLHRKEKHPNWKGGIARLPNCLGCGKKLRHLETKRCKKCYGVGLRGENHYRWIKDRTQISRVIKKGERRNYAYYNWRNEVYKKDNWKCRLLNSDCKGRLESHHIFNWIDYPELRYLLTNGITLCAFHHPRGREEEKRMIPIFQELLSVSKD